MEKYSDQLKLDLSKAIQDMLSKKGTIQLMDEYTLIGKVGVVSVNNLSELKLIDFIGGRKFEAAGEGRFTINEKTGVGEKLRHVAFQIRNVLVNYIDATKHFEVLDLGKFTALEFVKNV
jgi:hypothetical protein